tara:strand:- start:1118 stop:1357 length:240 start_codon:yes stop_codon:yes gene_type:complete
METGPHEELAKLKSEIMEAWHELDVLRTSMELDLAKSLNGVRTAGVRTRKGLKLLAQQSQNIRKQLLKLQKQYDALKKQ